MGSGNFGTNLQAYALYRELEVLGYDTCILSSAPQFDWRYWIHFLLSQIGAWDVLHRMKRKALHLPFENGEHNRIEAWASRFFNTVKITSQCQLRNLVKNTECFVTGSDQIWNTYHSFDPAMFLDFAGDKRRVAYASSIGTASINPQYAIQMRELLLKFDCIALRERSGARLIADLTGRMDVIQVCDPTFLLTAKEWEGFSQSASVVINSSRPFIACYLLSKNAEYGKQIHDVCNRSGISRVVVVPACENPGFAYENAEVISDVDPTDFVKILLSASLVCTDSFHATAICINVEKPFVEFLRFSDMDIQSQNARIHDLLEQYHFESRMYCVDSDSWYQPMDFTEARRILVSDRSRSINYLVHAIGGERS